MLRDRMRRFRRLMQLNAPADIMQNEASYLVAALLPLLDESDREKAMTAITLRFNRIIMRCSVQRN